MKTIGITATALSLLLLMAAPIYAQHEQQGGKEDRSQQQSKHEQARPEKQAAQPQHQPAQRHEGAQAQHQPAQRHEETQRAQPQQRQDRNSQQQSKREPAKHEQRAQPQRHSDQKEARAPQRQVQERNQGPEHAQQQKRQAAPKRQEQAQRGRNNEQTRRTPAQHRVEQSAFHQHRSQHWDSDHRNWQQRGGYHGYRIPDDHFRGYFGRDHGFRINGLPFLVVGGYPRFQYSGYWFSMVDPWPEYWGNDWYDNDEVYVNYVDNGYYLFNSRYPTMGIAISISM